VPARCVGSSPVSVDLVRRPAKSELEWGSGSTPSAWI
jgi:hypothetical protein